MTEYLRNITPSQPDALAKANLDYDRALAEFELLHAQSIAKLELAQLAMDLTEEARKALRKAGDALDDAQLREGKKQ